jgi:hypothetical protein
MQINLTVDSTALSVSNGLYDFFATNFVNLRYNVSVVNFVAGQMNVFITPKSPSGSLTSLFTVVPQTYTKIGTFSIKILDPTKVARIHFIASNAPAYMDGQEFQRIFNPLGTRVYSNPNFYDSKVLTSLYLGRIYSNTSANYGWSQVGGLTLDQQYRNWTVAVNTSVWDTSSTSAKIDSVGSKAARLRIHPGARLKIISGGQLTCSDSTIISEARGLWVAAGIGSGGTGTADGSFIDNGTIVYNTGGTAEEELYLAGNRWHYVSSPISNATSLMFLNDYLRYYDEPTGYWSNYIIPTNVALTPMLGYEAYVNAVSKTRYFIGQFNTGSLSRTLTNSGVDIGIHHYGWNLLGNPYPSAQDFGSNGSPVAGWTWPGTGPFRTVYYLKLDPDSLTFQYATYIWSSGLGTNGGTQYIPSGQGYMIWEDPGTPSAVVSVTNATRVHNGQAFWKSSDETYSNLLRLTANANGYNDDAVVYFRDDASSAFEGYYDAFKLMNSGVIPSVYALTSDNVDVTIDVLPFAGVTTTVPLGFRCGAPGTYTFTASNLESFKSPGQVFIKDKLLNKIQELTNGTPGYTFDYQAGQGEGRFELIFDNPYFGVQTIASQNFQIYSFEDIVYIKNIKGGTTSGDVFIYDLTGRKMFQDKLQDNRINQYRLGVNEGYYLVKVITPDNTYHQKIYLK